jgi:hypothetical protein
MNREIANVMPPAPGTLQLLAFTGRMLSRKEAAALLKQSDRCGR